MLSVFPCFYCHTVSEFPDMTGDPIFTGPVEDNVTSVFCPGGFYTDFHFECGVQHPQQAVDNGARFNVSLTFDGETDPDNPDTHITTDATALTVSFPSLALRGNVGKSVNISLNRYILHCLSCGSIKEKWHQNLI